MHLNKCIIKVAFSSPVSIHLSNVTERGYMFMCDLCDYEISLCACTEKAKYKYYIYIYIYYKYIYIYTYKYLH